MRVAGADVPHEVGERFQPGFLGHGRSCPAFRPEREVEVFEFGRADAVLDLLPKRVRERSCFGYGLEDGLLAFFHLVEDIGPVAHFRHLRVIHASGLLFAVAADERDGVAFGEHLYAVFDLPGLELQQRGYVVEV